MSNQWDTLRILCPKLYKRGMYFECALGWYGLLYSLSIKIERLLEKYEANHDALEGEENEYSEMFAVQVKEKYGTLRFYMCCENEEISSLIQEAEKLSSQTCEICGAFGKMRSNRWIVVVCDKCYEEEVNVSRIRKYH